MKLRMSRLDLAMACPLSMLLEHSSTIADDASRGIAIHAYVADVPAMGREAALDRVPDELRDVCAAIDLSALPASRPDQYSAEVRVAYDPTTDTARVLRDDEAPLETELAGRADVVGRTFDAVVIIDYKSGWARRRAADSWQLAGYAVACARALGRNKATVAIVDRLLDGDPHWDVAQLDAMDLDARAADISDLCLRLGALSAQGILPPPVQGAHCDRCPAFEHCPAKTELLRQVALATLDPRGEESLTLPLTPETAPRIVATLEAADKLVKRAWAILDEYATQHPIPMLDGSEYGPRVKETEKIDASAAALVLREAYGQDVADAALRTEPTMTWSSLKAGLLVLQQRTPGAKITHIERSAREELRQAGAVHVVRSMVVDRHAIKPKALPARPAPR